MMIETVRRHTATAVERVEWGTILVTLGIPERHENYPPLYPLHIGGRAAAPRSGVTARRERIRVP